MLADLPHPFGADLAGSDRRSGRRPAGAPTVPLPGPGRRPQGDALDGLHHGRIPAQGRWRLREKTNAVAIMGGCQLDLRNAEVEGPDIVINAIAVMGGIEIIVPEGIEVELGGIAIMGGKDGRRLKDVPPLPGSPVIRVRAFAFWGGVTVRSRPAHCAAPVPFASTVPSPVSPDRRPHRSGPTPDRRGGRRPRARSADELQGSGLPDGTVTIMFSDIEGFTAITERLGDRGPWTFCGNTTASSVNGWPVPGATRSRSRVTAS